IMDEAAREAHQWLDTQYEASLSPPFYEGAHWALPAKPEMIKAMQCFFADPDSYPTDDRGMTYSMAFFCPKRPAAGSYYLMSTKDRSKQPLKGSETYRLNVPADAPVSQYWSVTAYDRATHALI